MIIGYYLLTEIWFRSLGCTILIPADAAAAGLRMVNHLFHQNNN